MLKIGKKKARICGIQALFLNLFRLPGRPNNGHVGNNNRGGDYCAVAVVHSAFINP